MATLPFLQPASHKRREPLTGARLIIVAVATGFAIFLLWAALAQVDEVTSGQGKVIPSSKVQLIQASEPATVAELLVRSGQRVKKGQLLARLDNPQSRQIQAETDALEARSARLSGHGYIARPGAAKGNLEVRTRRCPAGLRRCSTASSGDDERRQPQRSTPVAKSGAGAGAADRLAPLAARTSCRRPSLPTPSARWSICRGRIAAARERVAVPWQRLAGDGWPVKPRSASARAQQLAANQRSRSTVTARARNGIVLGRRRRQRPSGQYRRIVSRAKR